ncbi:hypothetical protein Aros01_07248 [Streptosporangium roseum]|uniref:Uncharacterized protein n=1 Tax=Streptosporangium roseum (strain ATCC 12428 / DSM 43021 / JCM 3005 / KCTC 9067 / NCIMB 10171 / NRRL 2505 / NI 9100) TaxID=479432 RepID=D2B7B8_STRRD|nr:hypothetical protein Sros_6942 [Streptosporangium roseum DSM 43021]
MSEGRGGPDAGTTWDEVHEIVLGVDLFEVADEQEG